MSIRYTKLRDGSIVLHVPVDDQTAARLATVADEAHSDIATIAGSILHDVLHDDELAHAQEQPPIQFRLN